MNDNFTFSSEDFSDFNEFLDDQDESALDISDDSNQLQSIKHIDGPPLIPQSLPSSSSSSDKCQREIPNKNPDFHTKSGQELSINHDIKKDNVNETKLSKKESIIPKNQAFLLSLSSKRKKSQALSINYLQPHSNLNLRPCKARPENDMICKMTNGSFECCLQTLTGRNQSQPDISDFQTQYYRTLTGKKKFVKKIIITIHDKILHVVFGFPLATRNQKRNISLYFEYYLFAKDKILSFLEKNKAIIKDQFHIPQK